MLRIIPANHRAGSKPSYQAGGPFDEVYCVDWGDDLDEGRFDEAGERLADYLFANTLAPQRTFFEACRAKSAPSCSSPEIAALATVNSIQKVVHTALAAPLATDSTPAGNSRMPIIKSCGIRHLELSRRNLPREWIDYFCRKVVDHWQRADNKKAHSGTLKLLKSTSSAAVIQQILERSADEEVLSHNPLGDKLNFADLFNRAYARLGVKLNVLDENEFHKMLEEHCFESPLGEREVVQLSSRQIFHAIDLFLGPACKIVEWKDSPEHSLQKSLLDALHAVARDESRSLAENVLLSCGKLPSGCASAQAVIEDCLAAIRQEDEQNLRRQDRLREIISQADRILSTQTAILSAPKKSWWQSKSSAKVQLSLAPCWLEYALWRRDLMVLQAINFMLQSLKSELCSLNDKLRDLQHDIHRLGECFPVENLPAEDCEKKADDPASEDYLCVINEQLRAKAKELIQSCIESCRSLVIMESKAASPCDEEVFQIVDTAQNKLRSAVESVLLTFLRPQMFQIWTQEAAAASGKPWEDLFASAKPLLDDCGGTARILISAPAHLLDLLKNTCCESTGIEPTTIQSAEEQIFVCYELDQLSLPRVALHCLKDNRDLVSLAQRLQTRIDVAWSSRQ